MRLTAWGILASAVLVAMAGPAMAAWHGYISHPLGFGFAAPGELKVEKGTYRSALAGQREHHDLPVFRRRHRIQGGGHRYDR